MKRKKPDFAQMNLALATATPVELPDSKQRELALALADLLVNAVINNDESKGTGADHEPETTA